jgi:hypothetical protein
LGYKLGYFRPIVGDLSSKHSGNTAGMVASLAFLKPDFENLAFFEVVWLFLFLEKKPDRFWLFSGFFWAVWLFLFLKKKPDSFSPFFGYFLAFFGVVWLFFGNSQPLN